MMCSPSSPKKLNAFGMELPAFHEILNIKRIEQFVTFTLESVLEALGVRQQHLGKIIELAKSPDVSDYERLAFNELKGVSARIERSLDSRAKLVASHVKPYLVPQNILDVGAGDGRVAEIICQAPYLVTLTDVYKNPNLDNVLKNRSISFVPVKQGQPLAFEDESFDTTMALMSKHHCDDPIFTIKEITRVTKEGGRVIVIESVYGISPDAVEDFQVSDHRESIKNRFKQLDFEEQRLSNIFFDHFYNRVICDPALEINVPYNFNTPEGWRALYEENGLKQEKLKMLGIDMALVPEYHTLHLLKKI